MSERTIEIFKLAELMVEKNFRTIIDVGCKYSLKYWQPIFDLYYYDKKPCLEGFDKEVCLEEESSGLFYKIHHLDINDYKIGFYPELVTCISTIEHNESSARIALLRKLCEISSHQIFLTFPYGLKYHNEEYNYSIIDYEEFKEYLIILKSFYFDYDYHHYWCETPNGLDQIWWPMYGKPNIKHDPTIGVQSVMILNAYKEHIRV